MIGRAYRKKRPRIPASSVLSSIGSYFFLMAVAGLLVRSLDLPVRPFLQSAGWFATGGWFLARCEKGQIPTRAAVGEFFRTPLGTAVLGVVFLALLTLATHLSLNWFSC